MLTRFAVSLYPFGAPPIGTEHSLSGLLSFQILYVQSLAFEDVCPDHLSYSTRRLSQDHLSVLQSRSHFQHSWKPPGNIHFVLVSLSLVALTMRHGSGCRSELASSLGGRWRFGTGGNRVRRNGVLNWRLFNESV